MEDLRLPGRVWSAFRPASDACNYARLRRRSEKRVSCPIDGRVRQGWRDWEKHRGWMAEVSRRRCTKTRLACAVGVPAQAIAARSGKDVCIATVDKRARGTWRFGDRCATESPRNNPAGDLLAAARPMAPSQRRAIYLARDGHVAARRGDSTVRRSKDGDAAGLHRGSIAHGCKGKGRGSRVECRVSRRMHVH